MSLVALALAFALAAPAFAESPQHPGGFWKCRPPSNVKGAFDSEDPVGLAAHAHIATTCELHWSDGHGTTYCFATPPSLLLFKDDPSILAKAEAFWRSSQTTR